VPRAKLASRTHVWQRAECSEHFQHKNAANAHCYLRKTIISIGRCDRQMSETEQRRYRMHLRRKGEPIPLMVFVESIRITSSLQARVGKKKDPVFGACSRCRARKTKCSGQRPVCSFCDKRNLNCEWEVLGESTTSDLKRKFEDAVSRSEDMRVLIEALQFGSDQISTLILASLRLGVSVFDLAESIRTGTVDRYRALELLQNECC
jgi:hypothetical protein